MESSFVFDVVDQARIEARSFEHRLRFVVIVRPVVRRVLRLPVSIARSFAVGLANRFARQLSLQATVFRGMRLAITEHPRDYELDPRDELRALVDNMEKDLEGLRSSLLNLIQGRKDSKRPESRFSRSLESLQLKICELRDEVRLFKGALQAHDANVPSRAGTLPCLDAAEIDSHLSKLTLAR